MQPYHGEGGILIHVLVLCSQLLEDSCGCVKCGAEMARVLLSQLVICWLISAPLLATVCLGWPICPLESLLSGPCQLFDQGSGCV